MFMDTIADFDWMSSQKPKFKCFLCCFVRDAASFVDKNGRRMLKRGEKLSFVMDIFTVLLMED